ncbi:MAG TPA: hypothetical protein DDW23_04205 [Planctomycetes bacterium]|nr:hypothetical protein [Planctomycetota bacterium]
MVGIGISTTTGIATVVKNWLATDFPDRVSLRYLSTQRAAVPGAYFAKFVDGCFAFARLVFMFLGRLILLKGRWDVMHVHQSSWMSFWRKQPIWHFGALCARRRVVHLHGSEFKDFYASTSGLRRRLIQRFFERSDANFVLSKEWAEWVEGICRRPTRIDIVYNAALRQKMPDRRGRPTVTFALMGRMGERKGVFDLLEAFKKMAGNYPSARLILAGDGEVEKVRSLVAAAGLEDKVEVPGWVSGADAESVFERADVYCLPSYNEGLPGSILEAMAVGLPVISTPVGGILEAVQHESNGLIVEPGDIAALADGLVRLAADVELREAMGEASYALFEKKFDLDAIVEQVVGIYETLFHSAA